MEHWSNLSNFLRNTWRSFTEH